ncbi:ASI1-immunoprecipitated protein 1-like [Apium graveolens]|uniref:ASI1-immunoprecipitated protein 1-like n=1 Tax=Apium graveolens TaxID=4045 RepID=UPI003D7AF2D3
MEQSAEAEYAAFEEKVKRTVYLDNLKPQVTDAVIRNALDQFGKVVNVHFVPNFTGLKNIPSAALVEMEDAKQASQIIAVISNSPFMICGMPRPVRATAAEIEMFHERPRKPGGKIPCRWLDEKDPDFEVAQKMKKIVLKHASEASFLHQKQLLEEEKIHKRQAETLKANYKKYEQLQRVLSDGTAQKLGSCYDMNMRN